MKINVRCSLFLLFTYFICTDLFSINILSVISNHHERRSIATVAIDNHKEKKKKKRKKNE